jgi:hypothetical protein
MRTLFAIVIFVGGTLALNSTADAAHRYKRSAERYYYAPPYYYVPKREAECARARHEDPTGVYAGYPCWAREALGRGTQGGGRGGRR